MEELEKLEYPKPNREFIYSTFNAFADRHPWVGQENIRPKSIAREMFESFRSFSDYIRDYELQRAEGVLLRHLNSVYKVLAQTVPDAAKNDAVREMELYLGTMIRQVDSSLLDEWEKMRDPNYQRAETKEVRPPGAEEAAADITRDTKAFTAAIRNRIFTFLRGLVIRRLRAGPRRSRPRRRTPTASPGPPSALAAGAGRLSRRARAHLPGPERPQPPPHLRDARRGQAHLARAADAGGPGGTQRLGGGVRSGFGPLARGQRTRAAPAKNRRFVGSLARIFHAALGGTGDPPVPPGHWPGGTCPTTLLYENPVSRQDVVRAFRSASRPPAQAGRLCHPSDSGGDGKHPG